MRWAQKKPPYRPRAGSTRVIVKFLWWPTTSYIILDSGAWQAETRWLETCKVHQTYVDGDLSDFWRNDRWIHDDA